MKGEQNRMKEKELNLWNMKGGNKEKKARKMKRLTRRRGDTVCEKT